MCSELENSQALFIGDTRSGEPTSSTSCASYLVFLRYISTVPKGINFDCVGLIPMTVSQFFFHAYLLYR